MDDPWRILSVLGTDATLTGLFCAAKAAGVLAVAGLVALAMRRRAAATRHLVWGLGLAGALAVLPLTLALPRWRLPVLSAPAKAELPMVLSHNVDIRQADGPAVVDMRMTPSEAPAPSPSPQVSPNELNVTEAPPMVAWPLVVWGAGTLAVLVWGALGWASTWMLGRKAESVTDPVWVEAVRDAADRLGTRRGVTLLRGGPAAMPLTWGILHPVLLLPEEANLWPIDRRRAVLLHELAHVRRRDCLTQWLGLAACAAYWFNPQVWWAASRLRPSANKPATTWCCRRASGHPTMRNSSSA